MKSPFPGMDPYLEARWSDVHATLIALVKEALQPLLPRDLRARSEERVLVEEDEDETRSYRSDIAVIETGRPAGDASRGVAAVADVEPIAIRRYRGPVLDRFIQIIDLAGGKRVVTAIEILSPWNKASGRLNREYVRKLDDYADGEVSVVELDLLHYPARGNLPVTEADIPVHRRAPYYACVRYGWKPDYWYAYPISLRRPLPRIAIPLRRTDPPVGVELQPIIERAYAAGGHDDIDYAKPVDPPLEPEDAAWVDELLRAAGKR